MTTDQVIYKRSSLKDIQRQMLICWLYLLHRLTGQPLKLFFISNPPSILFSGIPLTLRWQISGCHRIVINNRLILPGNAGFVKLSPAFLSGPVHIRFEGCNKMIEKKCTTGPICLRTKLLSCSSLKDPNFRFSESLHMPELRAQRSTHRVVLPAPVFSFAPRSVACFYSETPNRSLALHLPAPHILLESCELPQLLN